MQDLKSVYTSPPSKVSEARTSGLFLSVFNFEPSLFFITTAHHRCYGITLHFQGLWFSDAKMNGIQMAKTQWILLQWASFFCFYCLFLCRRNVSLYKYYHFARLLGQLLQWFEPFGKMVLMLDSAGVHILQSSSISPNKRCSAKNLLLNAFHYLTMNLRRSCIFSAWKKYCSYKTLQHLKSYLKKSVVTIVQIGINGQFSLRSSPSII